MEVCASIKAIKYIHKYIYHHTTMEFCNQDDVTQYLDAWYMSAIECCWHIYEFPMHSENPSVVCLPVHLPGQHMVTYDPDEDVKTVLERGASKLQCSLLSSKPIEIMQKLLNTHLRSFLSTLHGKLKRNNGNSGKQGHLLLGACVLLPQRQVKGFIYELCLQLLKEQSLLKTCAQ